MPNTTNFNFPTPADTDLVKDGAAAIRSLGNSIDGAFVDLKGGTTGQILTKATNTDLDYTWTTPNVGDITEVQAGTGITITNGTGPIPTVAINNAVTVTLTDSQTLTNKTLTAPAINNPVVRSPEELFTVSAIASTGTINFDMLTQGVLYYTTNASGNWTLNVRGNSGTTLNSILNVGDSITIAFLAAQGSTAFRHTALTLDGNAQTVLWSGGTAPAAGNASSTDAYSFTIIKTAATPTYVVFGAGPIRYA